MACILLWSSAVRVQDSQAVSSLPVNSPPTQKTPHKTTHITTNLGLVADWRLCRQLKGHSSLAIRSFCTNLPLSISAFPSIPPSPQKKLKKRKATYLHKLLPDGRLGTVQTSQKGLLQFGRQFTSRQALIPVAKVELCWVSMLRSCLAWHCPRPV